MFKKIIREPLVHFLVAGFFLFVYFRSCSTGLVGEETILVNEANILEFMQYQSKAFQEETFALKLAELPEAEKEQLVEQYIQDEVLYREALKLGLDQNDYVLKRRIIQKMEFILDDFAATEQEVVRDSIEAYFQREQVRYFQAANFTFAHIFFKQGQRVEARAKAFMNDPQHQRLSISASLKFGDRFLYHRNYAAKDAQFLESHFGADFVGALEQLKMDETQWQGPLRSEHGLHWVKLMHKEKAGVPSLSDIQQLVERDYLDALRQGYKAKRIKDLIANYKVKVNW